MKRILLISVFTTFFLGMPLLSATASQCSGSGASGMTNPACWTQATTTCTYDCGHPLYICQVPNPSSKCVGETDFWCQYFSLTDDGHSCALYSSWCINSCGGGDCENQNPTNYTTTTTTCHYISSYTYGSCVNNYKAAATATWATTSGSSCTNVAQSNYCNSAPAAPTITGEATGNPNTNYTFTVLTTDPDGNRIRYAFDWNNDGTIDQHSPAIVGEVYQYINSGVSQAATHQWSSTGAKIFNVKACDNTSVAGACSAWTSFTITLNTPVAGACGTRNKNESNTPYATTATSTNWDTDTPCANGTTDSYPNGAVSFPAIGQTTANWTCSGINGSTVNATNCHASRDWYHCTTNPLLDLSNASQCPGYDDRLSISETRTLWDTCDSDKKCEYKCNANFHKEGNTCKCDPTPDCTDGSNICIGGSCDKCDDNVTITTVPGTKDCRDLNWREVAPN